MTDRVWLQHYPEGVAADIDAGAYPSLVELLEDSFEKYASRVAYSSMGVEMRYSEVDRLSQLFAAYLQRQGLQRGDRVAVMMPNVFQYPIVVAGILRAGCVLVNVNPLYTPRELEHQLKDAGATAMVVLENFASTVQQCIEHTAVKHIVVCTLGDQLGCLKGWITNWVVRHVKKMVPPYALPGSIGFKQALQLGEGVALQRPAMTGEDIAALQYTGGTTGVSKGAVLRHRNLLANVLQAEAWFGPALKQVPAGTPAVTVCALPLYHIFAFTVCMMLSLRTGGKVVLIANPRDMVGLLKELGRHTIHVLPGVNTLFNGMVNHPDFMKVDWSHLKVAIGGGAAVQSGVAQQWLEKTGKALCEGYGLSETSPVVTANPVLSTQYSGAIGFPLSSTLIQLIDDDGNAVPQGQPGEIAIKGPQVMAGYWQRPDETAQVMTADGYFKTGDIGVMDARGCFKIVDRKKDMILVSGFNVYPNELEDVVARMPGVMEVACVGVPDAKTGEAIKLVVVKRDAGLTADAVKAYCKEHLTGYKQPRVIEFRTELPKSPIGKILRRALRDTPA